MKFLKKQKQEASHDRLLNFNVNPWNQKHKENCYFGSISGAWEPMKSS